MRLFQDCFRQTILHWRFFKTHSEEFNTLRLFKHVQDFSQFLQDPSGHALVNLLRLVRPELFKTLSALNITFEDYSSLVQGFLRYFPNLPLLFQGFPKLVETFWTFFKAIQVLWVPVSLNASWTAMNKFEWVFKVQFKLWTVLNESERVLNIVLNKSREPASFEEVWERLTVLKERSTVEVLKSRKTVYKDL